MIIESRNIELATCKESKYDNWNFSLNLIEVTIIFESNGISPILLIFWKNTISLRILFPSTPLLFNISSYSKYALEGI